MPSLAVAGFMIILGVVCVTDLRSRRIPNRATGLAALIALAAILASGPSRLPVALMASLAVSLPLLIASLINPAGMGMGDVKLMAVIGLYLGWTAVGVLLAGLLVATFAGGAASLLARRPLGETELPLAPFLTLAALVPLLALL